MQKTATPEDARPVVIVAVIAAKRDLESHVYPGNLRSGQSIVQNQDRAGSFRGIVDNRAALPRVRTVLIAKPNPISSGDLLGWSPGHRLGGK